MPQIVPQKYIYNNTTRIRCYHPRGTYSVFRIPYSLFRIPCSVFRLSYSVLRVPYSVFRIPYSVFRIPYSLIPRSVFRIPSSEFRVPYSVSRGLRPLQPALSSTDLMRFGRLETRCGQLHHAAFRTEAASLLE
jgi:hypothetical protein